MRSAVSRRAPVVARSFACAAMFAAAGVPGAAWAQSATCSLDEALAAVAQRSDYGALAEAIGEAARAESASASLLSLPTLAYDAEIYGDRRVDDVHTALVGWELDLRRSPTLAREQADALAALAESDQHRLSALAALAAERAFAESARHAARAESLGGWAQAVGEARDHVDRLVEAGEAATVELMRLDRELARLDVEQRVELASGEAAAARLATLTAGRCTAFAAPSEQWWSPSTPTPDAGGVVAEARENAVVGALAAERALAQRAGRPTLSFGVGAHWNITPTGAATGAAFALGFAPGRRRAARLGVESLDAQLDAARIELSRATTQLDSVEQIARVAAELSEVANRWRQSALGHDIAMAEAAQQAWRAGEIDTFDLLDTLRAGSDDQLYFIDIMTAAHALSNEARAAILEALP